MHFSNYIQLYINPTLLVFLLENKKMWRVQREPNPMTAVPQEHGVYITHCIINNYCLIISTHVGVKHFTDQVIIFILYK